MRLHQFGITMEYANQNWKKITALFVNSPLQLEFKVIYLQQKYVSKKKPSETQVC